jgi:fucose permease
VIFLFALLFVIVWIIGAALTAKADAALASKPTSYRADFIVALFCWPVVAVLILRNRHHVRWHHGKEDTYRY